MNILIPTDFYENSQNAIRYALEYFANEAVNFYILNASAQKPLQLAHELNYTVTATTASSTVHEKEIGLLEEVERLKLLAKNANHHFYAVQEEGSLIEAIRKQIEQKEIDYILIGTKGASKSGRQGIGSKTWEVITKVKCPVFVIPRGVQFKPINNVTFLTDYNCIYRNKIIAGLSLALRLQNAALRVLHIRTSNTRLTATQTDNKGYLHYFFRETKHSFHFLENKSIETGVQEFVNTWEIGMIAIVAKNLNLTQRLLFNPSNIDVTKTYKVPFLILHE